MADNEELVKPTVYLAARYSRAPELRGYRDQLEAAGLHVTSRWIEGGHELTKEGSTQAHETERTRFASEDRADCMAADVVVSFTEEPRKTTTRGGRHVEYGMALASGKHVVVIGHRENVFHCLPEALFFPDFALALPTIVSLRPLSRYRAGGEAVADLSWSDNQAETPFGTIYVIHDVTGFLGTPRYDVWRRSSAEDDEGIYLDGGFEHWSAAAAAAQANFAELANACRAAIPAQTREAVLEEAAKVMDHAAQEAKSHWIAAGRDEDAKSHYLWSLQTAEAGANAIRALASSPAPEPKQGEGSPTSTESRE